MPSTSKKGFPGNVETNPVEHCNAVTLENKETLEEPVLKIENSRVPKEKETNRQLEENMGIRTRLRKRITSLSISHHHHTSHHCPFPKRQQRLSLIEGLGSF